MDSTEKQIKTTNALMMCASTANPMAKVAATLIELLFALGLNNDPNKKPWVV